MTKVLGIFSAKGGVGKTTTAINLANSLTHLSRTVILVEGNISKPDIAIHFGIYNSPEITKIKNIKKNIKFHSSNLLFIPSSISYESLKDLDKNNFKNNIQELKKECELIILDTGIEDFNLCKEVCDLAIIVTTPDLPSIINSLKTIYKLNIQILGIIINKSIEPSISTKNINALLETPILGTISYDNRFNFALKKHEPVTSLHDDILDKYKKIASKIIGQEYNPHYKPKTSNMKRFLLSI